MEVTKRLRFKQKTNPRIKPQTFRCLEILQICTFVAKALISFLKKTLKNKSKRKLAASLTKEVGAVFRSLSPLTTSICLQLHHLGCFETLMTLWLAMVGTVLLFWLHGANTVYHLRLHSFSYSEESARGCSAAISLVLIPKESMKIIVRNVQQPKYFWINGALALWDVFQF